MAEMIPLRGIAVDGPPLAQLRDAVPVEDLLGRAVDVGPGGRGHVLLGLLLLLLLLVVVGDVIGHVVSVQLVIAPLNNNLIAT